jgi:hypothetical protein
MTKIPALAFASLREERTHPSVFDLRIDRAGGTTCESRKAIGKIAKIDAGQNRPAEIAKGQLYPGGES